MPRHVHHETFLARGIADLHASSLASRSSFHSNEISPLLLDGAIPLLPVIDRSPFPYQRTNSSPTSFSLFSFVFRLYTVRPRLWSHLVGHAYTWIKVALV